MSVVDLLVKIENCLLSHQGQEVRKFCLKKVQNSFLQKKKKRFRISLIIDAIKAWFLKIFLFCLSAYQNYTRTQQMINGRLCITPTIIIKEFVLYKRSQSLTMHILRMLHGSGYKTKRNQCHLPYTLNINTFVFILSNSSKGRNNVQVKDLSLIKAEEQQSRHE